MEKILITGGSGFIGTHLADRFCERSQLVLLDNGRRNSLMYAPGLASHPNVKIVTGDTLDPASIDAAMAGVDTVIHLAAIAGVSSYHQESLKTLQVNILGTVNVLESAVRNKVKHVVDFSTSEIFGSDALWVGEERASGIGPSSEKRWVYASSKLAGEQFTFRYGEKYGFNATVVRPFNIYGPRQTGEGAISNFLGAATSGKPLKVYGDGTPLRAWCFVSDMVDAVEAILQRPEKSAGMAFNIGNPREVETTLGLARRVARMFPGTKIEFARMEGAEVRARVPVIDRSRDLLGFEPKVDLDEGLRATAAWIAAAKADAK